MLTQRPSPLRVRTGISKSAARPLVARVSYSCLHEASQVNTWRQMSVIRAMSSSGEP